MSSRGDEALARARKRFPDFEVPEATFRAWLAEREAEHGAIACVEDLYLACACASGDARALRAFDQTVGADLSAMHRRFSYLPGEVDDFRQVVYEKLFAGDRPKI